MLLRTFTSLLLIAGFLAALFWTSVPFWTGLMVAILFLAAAEWANLAKRRLRERLAYAGGLCALCVGLLWLRVDTAPVYWAALLFWLLAPLLLWRGVALTAPIRLLLLGVVVLLPAGLAAIELRIANPYALLAVVGLVVMADSGAYLVGRRFGRRKLAPHISPGKTWEGVLGGALAVAAYTVALKPIVLPQWDLAAALYLATAAAMLGLSICGDLLESWVKRQAGVKDSGNLLPGHGGVLDRIDSLTAVLPAAALFYFWMP